MSAADILDRARMGDVLTAYHMAKAAQQENPADPNILLMRAVYASACGLREDCIAVIDAVPDILSHPMAKMWGLNALVLNVDTDRLKKHGLVALPEDEAALLALEPGLVLQVAFGLHLLIADPETDRDDLRHIAQLLLHYAIAKDAAHLAVLAGKAAIKLDGPEGVTEWRRSTAPGHVVDPLLDMLLPECYRADPARHEPRMKAIAEQPAESVFPVFGAVPRIGHRQPMPVAAVTSDDAMTPVIDAGRLAASMRQVQAIVDTWLAGQGDWQNWIAAVSNAGASPLLVASTGRVGTMAIAGALQQSGTLLPFHYLNNQPGILEQNRLLYMLMTGTVPEEALIALLQDWLRSRRAEIDFARFSGKRAVLVNHLDTVFAPVLLACFPDSRVIYAERDMRKTFLSLGYKNQFGYTQLRHLRYTLSSDANVFAGIRDEALSHDDEVVWYMAVTRALIAAVCEVRGDDGVRTLDMEKIFAGEVGEQAAFRDAFGLNDSDAGSVQSAFADRVNEKAFFALAPGIEDKVRDGLFEASWTRVTGLPLS
ncbi:MAG: sulfotransferase [Alphaproteobacteria bacterium]